MSKPTADLSLYLVAGPKDCASGDLITTVAKAVRGGVTLVQLRDKTCSDENFISLGKQLVEVLNGTGVPLIINDRVHLLDAIGAAGVHVGVSDMPAAQVRAQIGPDKLIGTSVKPDDLSTLPDPQLVDHVGIGPVFATATKPDHDTPIGWDGLARLISHTPVPAIAIGGVGKGHASHAAKAGAKGICVVSAICGAPDPRAAAATLKAEIEEATS